MTDMKTQDTKLLWDTKVQDIKLGGTKYRIGRTGPTNDSHSRTDASDLDPNPTQSPRSRHNVLVGPIRWFAVTQRSDTSDAIFRRSA